MLSGSSNAAMRPFTMVKGSNMTTDAEAPRTAERTKGTVNTAMTLDAVVSIKLIAVFAPTACSKPTAFVKSKFSNQYSFVKTKRRQLEDEQI
jgi:hypothetical protein